MSHFSSSWIVLKSSSLSPQFSSVHFSHSVMSDSLGPHESQPTRPPCPSPTPGVYSNSCSSSWWCLLLYSFYYIAKICPWLPSHSKVFSWRPHVLPPRVNSCFTDMPPFESFSIPFIKVLYFSVYRYFTFLLKFIPKCYCFWYYCE